MLIDFLNHIIETKGFLHGIERSAQVFMRYSFGRARFSEMMRELDQDLGSMGVRVTFCITASLLENHYGFFERFRDLGHEFAAHGYFHTNMKTRSLVEQKALIRKSYNAFEKAKLRVYGFRCPYLSYNDDTLAALRKSPFVWTSNNVILWDETPRSCRRSEEHLRKLTLLYNTSSPELSISVPAVKGKLIDIPITAPDDEMLFERYRIKERAAISSIWQTIFMKIHSRGELFHLLFHPERFKYFEASIKDVAGAARAARPRVWFATLNEITSWWERRRKSVWKPEKTGDGWRVRLKCPREATVLQKDVNGKGTGDLICGAYAQARGTFSEGAFQLDTDDIRRHTIQISRNCSPDVESFLVEEGFLTSVVEYPHRNALFIDGYAKFAPRDRRLLLDVIDNSSYPLLRLWRWPHGAQSAFTVSSDVDSINVSDFFKRFIYF
ncbi:MAG: polysaccharide deacetylase family protein [Deltaproteobacteria bacterium]|nr:polysaccharide deacetylase family protein [Deltaproteobacteria bacterium]MCL4872589.1 polysaccharide deacetylase family protein [bacterium]